MFETLIESRRKTDTRRSLGVGFVSLAIHTAIIATAIVATVTAGQSDTKVRSITMVYVAPERPEHQDQIEHAINDLWNVVLPKDILDLTDIPQIDIREQFADRQDHSRSVVGDGLVNTVGPTGDVYAEALVEEKPSLLSAPQPSYPEVMHQASVGGRVLIQAIIDTSGRAEKSSVKIIESPDPAFDPGSRNWILRALFRPARVHGRAVRVLIQVPIDYRITGR